MDQQHRFVMIDTETKPRVVLSVNLGRTSPEQTVRYQLHNHLGSAALAELDDTAQVISYEEYHPYGTTAFQAKNSGIKAAAKRYRYTSMERDEESGLEYHSARYYLTWLGRWGSGDPSNLLDSTSMYAYVNGNPIRLIDTNGRQAAPAYNINVDENKTDDQQSKLDAVGLLVPIVPVARGLFATVTGQVSTDYLVPGIGSIAVWFDEAPRLGYKAAETVDNLFKGDVKQAVRSGVDTAVHAQNIGFSLLPFLTEVARRPPTPTPKSQTPVAEPAPVQKPPVPVVDPPSKPPAPVEKPIPKENLPAKKPAAPSEKLSSSPEQAGTTQKTPLGRKAGLERATKVRDLVNAKVGAVLELSDGTVIEGSSSTVVETRPKGLNRHYKHAEIDVLLEASKKNLSGTSAVLYVTEHLCAGACLTTNVKGNITTLFENSGMKMLTIHSPEATIVLERSAQGKAVISSYSVK